MANRQHCPELSAEGITKSQEPCSTTGERRSYSAHPFYFHTGDPTSIYLIHSSTLRSSELCTVQNPTNTPPEKMLNEPTLKSAKS